MGISMQLIMTQEFNANKDHRFEHTIQKLKAIMHSEIWPVGGTTGNRYIDIIDI